MNKSTMKPKSRPPVLMYLAGGLAGVLFGALVLWMVLPAQAVARTETLPVAAAAAAPAPLMPEPHATEAFARVGMDELKAGFDQNAVTIIDVRDMQSYLASHIPGALHIPVSMIEGEVGYLPKGKPIVTYCSCPAEESSGQAVLILAHAGIANASALKGGFQEWQARGFPTKSGKE